MMGKILAKLEQLFTPPFLHSPSPTASDVPLDYTRARGECPCPGAAPGAGPLSPGAGLEAAPGLGEESLSSTDSSSASSLTCREFMGSIVARLRRHKEEAAAADTLSASQKVLPFDKLPRVCKMKIFMYLTMRQRGVAAKVSREWNDLIGSQSLWTDLDLTQLSCRQTDSSLFRRHRCHHECHDTYERRVASLLNHLADIDTPVHRLTFVYDIRSNQNRFLNSLTEYLAHARCSELWFARLIWDRFPDTAPPDTSSTQQQHPPSESHVSRQRHRQRHFVRFFEDFVAYAPNVRVLQTPFDWSASSMRNLARLPQLESLTLDRYSVYQPLDRTLLADVIAALPHLKSLKLEIWSASGASFLAYNLRSSLLENVDIAGCRGFVLTSVELPRLRSLRVERRPWCGSFSLDEARTNQTWPCLLEVLIVGAPRLETFNGYQMKTGWRGGEVDIALSLLLKSVCACPLHYRT